ncbi:VanZ family protein [Actinosynnema sp. NPDC050436]|uniref:VanZ family protein n=1 Tax=Actinosynnema sp. NPDC050436 TaxID=3155659 RepID=UPI0033F60DF9
MSARQDAYIAELVLSRPEVIAAMFFGCLVLGAVALGLARWRGWQPVMSVLAGCGLALALAVTLGRPGVLDAGVWTTDPVGVCALNDFSLTGSLERLNLVMLVPFAFFATVATRRPLTVLVLSAGLSMSVEVVQLMTGLGVCEAQDFYNNTVGAVGAVVVGALVTAVTGSSRTARGDRLSRDPAATR